MFLRDRLIVAAALGCLALPSRAAMADDLQSVLRQLDAAAADFHTTSADFEFDSYETDPIPIKDVQKGTVYYERKGSAFSMAAHIAEVNGKPVPKIYSYVGGVFKLDEPLIDQVTTFKSASKFESYVMLGFGASGKELADKWDITFVNTEMLDGWKTDKLELIAKDPTVRKNLPKVTIWIDPVRGVSLKQIFDEGEGQSRVCVYFNIKTKQPLPGDAFKLPTDAKTQYVAR